MKPEIECFQDVTQSLSSSIFFHTQLLEFDCKMSHRGSLVSATYPQLVALFGKAVEPLGGGPSLTEVGHWG